jgi:hypothetical protein
MRLLAALCRCDGVIAVVLCSCWSKAVALRWVAQCGCGESPCVHSTVVTLHIWQGVVGLLLPVTVAQVSAQLWLSRRQVVVFVVVLVENSQPCPRQW